MTDQTKTSPHDLEDDAINTVGAAMPSPADQLSWRGFNPQPEPPAINVRFATTF